MTSKPTPQKQIIDVLNSGPLRTGELIERLGYDAGSLSLTLAIGDENHPWFDSKHQDALAKMVYSGKVRHRQNFDGDNWYWLPSQEPPKHDLDVGDFNWDRSEVTTREKCGREQRIERYAPESYSSTEYVLQDDTYSGKSIGMPNDHRDFREFDNWRKTRVEIVCDCDYAVGVGDSHIVISICDSDFEEDALRDLLEELDKAKDVIASRLKFLWLQKNGGNGKTE